MAYIFNPFTGNFDNTGAGTPIGLDYDSVEIDKSNATKDIFTYKLESVLIRTIEVTYTDSTKEEILSIKAV